MDKEISRKLQRLNDFLFSDDVGDDAMLLAELDRFLAGIVVCPDLIRPSEWLPEVWGEDEPEFDDEGQASEIIGLIMGHYSDIGRALGRGRYEPIYDIDSDGRVI